MNQQLQDHARKILKEGLAKCTESQRNVFKRMYSHNDLMLGINAVVDSMPVGKLDHAMGQVHRTLG